MTAGQLLEWLAEQIREDGDRADLPVRVAYQPNMPLEVEVVGVARLKEAADPTLEVQGYGDGEHDYEGDQEALSDSEEERREALAEFDALEDAVYLVTPHQNAYYRGPKRLWGVGRDNAGMVNGRELPIARADVIDLVERILTVEAAEFLAAPQMARLRRRIVELDEAALPPALRGIQHAFTEGAAAPEIGSDDIWTLLKLVDEKAQAVLPRDLQTALLAALDGAKWDEIPEAARTMYRHTMQALYGDAVRAEKIQRMLDDRAKYGDLLEDR